jgi:hypothetical protein
MATKEDTGDRKHDFVFKASLDGSPDKKLELKAYLFATDGTLIAAAPLKDGEAHFTLEESAIRRAMLAIGPAIPKERSLVEPKLDTLRHLQAHEPAWRYQRDKRVYELGRIPELYWKWWLWCRCPVKGRVVKPVGAGDVYAQLPVCNVRVHICEVDRFPWIIARLPDLEIWRLRDELLEKIRWPLPIPEPDPWPIDPGYIDPLPPDVLVRDSTARILGRADAVALNPQPLPPREAQDLVRLGQNWLNPQPEPPMYAGGIATRALHKQLPVLIDRLEPTTIAAFSSKTASVVRQALIENATLLIPWLCHWPWLWRYFYFCDEVAVVTTDSHGRFSTDVWYLCAGDHPDLYFWVEASIGGSWETVYHPKVACHTYWNYVCGTDVTIRVTDPRVTGCGELPEIPGKKIVIKTIGRKISMGEIVRRGAGVDPDPDEGLFVRDAHDGILGSKRSPFGATLEPRVDFGSGITAAVATHYRWSYRKLGSILESDWKILDRTVSRHYEEATPTDDPPIYKSALVGPDPATAGLFFKIWPELPATGVDWEPLDERYDLASAYFDTAGLPLEDQGLKYELKLELFKAVGGVMQRVDLTTAGVDLYEITDPAPLSADTYVATVPTEDRLLKVPGVPGPHTVAYRLVLHVDNRPCFGEIREELLTGGIGAGRCGFLEYHPGNAVTLSFRAGHPGDFAWYSFSTVRVATHLPSASASGFVDAGANGFALAANVFSKTIPVSTLLTENEVLAPGEVSCTRAAFAEGLHVYALAGDGYSRLDYLDLPTDLRAFALTPA